MPSIPQRLSLLRTCPPLSICLLCRSPPPPRTSPRGTARRNIFTSSTSIKASLPTATTTTTAKDEKSVIVVRLAELARTGFTSEARVKLAIRGLEGHDAGVRVAVLGRSGSEGRFVATLLADPLSTEPEEERRWVKDILNWSTCLVKGNKGALLIRYGPSSSITTPHGSPISLLSVPSPLLKSISLEILLAPLPSSRSDLAVITLQATETPGARIIEYPVHKTLLWAGEGLTGLSTLLRQSYTSTGPVLKVVSLPGLTESSEEADVKIVDLLIAENAVKQLQSSVENAASFEHSWLQGGLQTIQRWIVTGASSQGAASGAKPAVKALVSSIVVEAESVIRQEEASIVAAKKVLEDRVTPTSSLLAPDDIVTLSAALKAWSATAHTELESGLTIAYSNKPWKALAWWKLLWGVDDVTNNARDMLTVGFLPESKRKLLFLAGRLSGAGYRGDFVGNALTAVPASVVEELKATRKSEDQDLGSSYLGGADFYPPQIFRSIDYFRDDVVPRLQVEANRLLMRAISVSTIGVIVSGLLYLSEVSVYSASSVATLCIVYSARSLQRNWDKAKSRFQDAVAEGGRIAIVETERWGWEKLREGRGIGERVAVEGGRLRKVQEGKKAMGDVRRALEKL